MPFKHFERYLLVEEHVGIVVVLSRHLVEGSLSALAAGIAAIILVVAHTDLLSFVKIKGLTSIKFASVFVKA